MTELFAKDFFALTKKTLDLSHLLLSGDTFQAARMPKLNWIFLLNKEHSNCLLSLDSPSAAFAAAAAGAANNCPDVNVEMAATTTTTRRENFGDAILKLFLLQKSFESCRLSFILFRKTAAQWSLFSKTPPFSSWKWKSSFERGNIWGHEWHWVTSDLKIAFQSAWQTRLAIGRCQMLPRDGPPMESRQGRNLSLGSTQTLWDYLL